MIFMVCNKEGLSAPSRPRGSAFEFVGWGKDRKYSQTVLMEEVVELSPESNM